MTTEQLITIADKFAINGNITAIKPLGNGLINDTFKVDTDGTEAYVLQRINNAIFKDVDLLQHNIECATAHIRKKGAMTLTFLPCKATGKTYWTDGETFTSFPRPRSVFIFIAELSKCIFSRSLSPIWIFPSAKRPSVS